GVQRGRAAGREERHRPGEGGRGDARVRDRLADGRVPRPARARPPGRGLVRLPHDAEGHEPRPRARPPARGDAAHDGGDEPAPDGGERDGDRRAGLRRPLRRARLDERRPHRGPRRSGSVSATRERSEVGLEQALEMYRRMTLIRLFEEQANELYRSAKMPGLTHLYIGEEAVAVGVCSALRRDDWITSTHRG